MSIECTFTRHGIRTFFQLQQALLQYRTETDELAFISDMGMSLQQSAEKARFERVEAAHRRIALNV